MTMPLIYCENCLLVLKAADNLSVWDNDRFSACVWDKYEKNITEKLKLHPDLNFISSEVF